jgi:hypothetical protein
VLTQFQMGWLVVMNIGRRCISSLSACFMSVGMGAPSSSSFHVPVVVWSMMGSSKMVDVLLGSWSR